ncbi:ubiquinone anaerobic biosynthesis accessory factor UbiT [Kangiella sp. M94]
MAESYGVLNLPFADNVKSVLLPKFASVLAPNNLGSCMVWVPQVINRKVIESVLNRVLQEQVADGDFDYLTDKWLQVEIRDARLFVTLGFRNGQFVCREVVRQACEANAHLSVMTVDAIDMVQHKVDPDTLFFQRKLTIGGDTELAHHVKNTLDTLDPEAIPKVVLTLLQHYQAIISRPAI